VGSLIPALYSDDSIPVLERFIASAGTYANLVRQAKSKQKIIDKMEAAGLIEKIEQGKPLHFHFEDVRKLPPPIIAFDEVAFSYSGQKQDYLYKKLSFGIEWVIAPAFTFSAC
jgi:ATP-binding cassette subfamily F protein 2